MSTSSTITFCITLYLSTIIVQGQSCTWTVGLNTLDLSCLAGRVLKTSAGGQDYSFSVCANSQQCEGRTVMAAQYPQDLEDRCFSLGEFDLSIQPEYSDISGGNWKFTYVGDAQDCPSPGREWIPTFICDTTVEYTIGIITEAPRCDFSVPIRTKYACVGHTYECVDDGLVTDDGLSTGWIIIIIFVSLFSLYCIIGYIYMAKRVNADKGFSDFRGNIPNKSMWVKFCLLVMAGCVVTKDYMVGLLNKDKGGDGVPDVEDSGSRDESDAAGYQLELE